MEIVLTLVLFLLALIPASIAHRKGRNFVLWYFYGLLLFVVALIHSLCISPSETIRMKKLDERGYMLCPYCKEPIRKDALICPHCRKEIATGKAISAYVPDENERQEEDQ